MLKIFLIPLLAAFASAPPPAEGAPDPRTVLGDAVAVWHLGGSGSDSIGIHGKARLGVAMDGAERGASLARGGDGVVAEIDGGYLTVGSPEGLRDLRNARAMTLCMRIRDDEGKWLGPLLAIDDPADDRAVLLRGSLTDVSKAGFREAARIGGGEAIEFRWRTDPAGRSRGDWGVTPDMARGVLSVTAPIGLIGARGWHDVVIRFTGPRLEMFVDGVLLDEEWPHGAMTGLDSRLLVGAVYEKGEMKTGFRGRIDHLALWKRALSDDEVAALSGGPEEIARRDREILGPETEALQYWRPRGHNAFVGDVMAFHRGNRLHVFYLFDRRHHGSKWGAGAHQFAHVSTEDLVHWEHHPMALPITDPTECSLGTGCFVFREGVWHLFYIQHGRRIVMPDAPYHGDNIFIATSEDGIHFRKRPEPVVGIRYDRGGDINPHVLLADASDRYVLTISGWKVFTSPNLLDWTEANLPHLGSIKWICTTDIRWNDWRYFVGCGSYVMTRKPIVETTEWVQPSSQAMRDMWGVPVACSWSGDRRLAIGFAGGGGYAQEMVFRELVQEEDGSLGMKWPAEMIPGSGKTLSRTIEPLLGDAAVSGGSVRLGGDGLAAAVIRDLPRNVRITLSARAKPGTEAFGLRPRGGENGEEGPELRIEPAASRMRYAGAIAGGSPTQEGVPGLGGEVKIDMIVKDDLVDVCVNDRRTLLARTRATGYRLTLFAVKGEATFEGLSIRPLLSEPAVAVDGTEAKPGRLLFPNSDFEGGDLAGWTAAGDAFDRAQPTMGDNTKARGRDPSRHQGQYWVGTFERYDGRSGKPGDARGDAPTGTLRSAEFAVDGGAITFLVSGGFDPDRLHVALHVGGERVRMATGHGTETMRLIVWDVSPYRGKKGAIVITDASTAPWGVINADDFRWAEPPAGPR